MTPCFVVDPLIITTPLPESSSDEKKAWLVSLEAWAAEITASPYEWRHVLACTHQLLIVNRFPTFRSLRETVKETGYELNIAHLSGAVDRFFQDRTHDLMMTVLTQYALAEVDVHPSEFLARNDNSVEPELSNAMVCLACDRQMGEAFASSVQVVTRPFVAGRLPVLVRATIGATDPTHLQGTLQGRSLEEFFETISSPDDLLGLASARDVLRAGAAAVIREVDRHAANLSHGQSLPLRLGDGFLGSVQSSGIADDQASLEKLLRLGAALKANIASELNVGLRQIRLSPNPNSGQVTRASDGAKAWRLSVTARRAGWRLHYWHIPRSHVRDEAIELANVVKESDPVEIPE